MSIVNNVNWKQWVNEKAGEQAEVTYENYNKIKSFEDVGYLLVSYVVSGGEVVKNVTRNDTIDATSIVVSLQDSMMARDGASFQTAIANTTYFLDFTKAGDWSWGTAHPVGVVGTDYLTVATVTTDSSRNVLTIIDSRGYVGGMRLKDDFGLEDYAKKAVVETQLADMRTDVKAFGAKGDGVTDDRAAIQAAINAAPNGSVVIFPSTPNGYLLKYTPGSTELLRINKPLILVGYGSRSTLLVSEDTPINCDVLRIDPNPALGFRGYGLQGLTILGKDSAKVARHAVHLDIQGTGQALAQMQIKECEFWFTGGYSIFLSHPIGNEGFYASQIIRNRIWSGINLQRCGDSVTVSENIIAGYNGIDVSLIGGSKEFVVDKNNFTARGGMIFRKGQSIKVINNNIEIAYADTLTPNGAYIDIDGGDETESYGMLTFELTGNDFSYRASTAPDGINAIRVNKTRRALIEQNVISAKAANHIVVTSQCQNLKIGYNLFSSPDPAGLVVDNGLGTLRSEVHEDTPAANHDVWLELGALLRRKGTTLRDVFNVFQHETNGTGIASHNYIWREGNAFNVKHTIGSQRRQTNDTLDAAVDILYFLADRVMFPSIGYSIRDDGNVAHRVVYRPAVPTSGSWAVGDICFNSVPVAGGKVGWVCISSGTPGIWKGFGTIDA